VRGEALGVRDGRRGPPERPLEGAGEVPVRGETQRAALRVPQADALDDGGLPADRLVLGRDVDS